MRKIKITNKMASLRPLNDKENLYPEIYQKNVVKNSLQIKTNFRDVLGNIENKSTQCTNKLKEVW